MSPGVSPNTQAVLLLTAPLLVVRNRSSARRLSHREYRGLARRLHAAGAGPAQLLTPDGSALLRECCGDLDPDRLEALLGRGVLLAQAVDHWQSRAIWVASRGDSAYPAALSQRLRDDAPNLLYGCGSPALWRPGGLAVVGSRNVGPEAADFAVCQGRLAAEAQRVLVSGGARGADRAAMDGAIEAGGVAVGVLAASLERTSMTRRMRNLLIEERLLLLSPVDPNARFNVGYAMGRNKVIYALAKVALAVEATVGKGGTWTGALEQIETYGTPVYVRASGRASPGLAALRDRGALAWPDPEDADELLAVLDVTPARSSRQGALFGQIEKRAKPDGEQAPVEAPAARVGDGYVQAPTEPDDGGRARGSSETGLASEAADDVATVELDPGRLAAELDAADSLYRHAATLILGLCVKPESEKVVAASLGVTVPTARSWLQRLVGEGRLTRSSRPVRYLTLKRAELGEVRGGSGGKSTAGSP